MVSHLSSPCLERVINKWFVSRYLHRHNRSRIRPIVPILKLILCILGPALSKMLFINLAPNRRSRLIIQLIRVHNRFLVSSLPKLSPCLHLLFRTIHLKLPGPIALFLKTRVVASGVKLNAALCLLALYSSEVR
jgi:hypothetical protein